MGLSTAPGARVSRLAGRAVGLALAGASLTPVPGVAQNHLLVISGLGGEPRYEATFREWALTLVEAAGRLGLAPEDVVWLAGAEGSTPAAARGPATKAAIGDALTAFGQRATTDARVWIVMFGHGSETGGAPRFHLPGPDLLASELAALLDQLPTQRTIVVNTGSASGGWVEVLAGPRRTVVTATRSAAERLETRFGGYFVAALADGKGDADMNGRVSLLEAFEYARAEVAAAYQREQRLLTEHALLDDDGDGRGSAAADPEQGDGGVAAGLFLAAAPERSAVGDPALAALYVERDSLEQAVTTLRSVRETLPAEQYERDLERLLLALGRVSRAIREREGGRPE